MSFPPFAGAFGENEEPLCLFRGPKAATEPEYPALSEVEKSDKLAMGNEP
jgi:hypothetical protein